jgi:hypothetical protein
MAKASFAFWNFLGFFSYILNLSLAAFVDVDVGIKERTDYVSI